MWWFKAVLKGKEGLVWIVMVAEDDIAGTAGAAIVPVRMHAYRLELESKCLRKQNDRYNDIRHLVKEGGKGVEDQRGRERKQLSQTGCK